MKIEITKKYKRGPFPEGLSVPGQEISRAKLDSWEEHVFDYDIIIGEQIFTNMRDNCIDFLIVFMYEALRCTVSGGETAVFLLDDDAAIEFLYNSKNRSIILNVISESEVVETHLYSRERFIKEVISPLASAITKYAEIS